MKFLLIVVLAFMVCSCGWRQSPDREDPQTAPYEFNIDYVKEQGNIKKGMEQDSLERTPKKHFKN